MEHRVFAILLAATASVGLAAVTQPRQSGTPPIAVTNATSAQQPLLQPLTLDHVNIRVSDVAKSGEFYEKLFSGAVLRIDNQPANPTSLPGPLVDVKAGANYLVISPAFPPNSPGLDHICYGISDYQTDVVDATLKGHGLQTLRGRLATNDLYIRDPDGNLIQLRPPGGWARLTANLGAVPQASTIRTGPPLSAAAINYIRLRVGDLATSGDFYNRLFGTEVPSRSTMSSRTFANGDSILELVPVSGLSGAAARPGIDVMGVAFIDFAMESARTILAGRDIQASDARRPGQLTVSDPDGIQIELSVAVGVQR